MAQSIINKFEIPIQNTLDGVTVSALRDAETLFADNKIRFFVTPVGDTDNPTDTGNWIVFSKIQRTENNRLWGIQIAMQTNTNNVYIRTIPGSTWTSWQLLGGGTV